MVAYARATPQTPQRVSDDTERQNDQSGGIAKLALLHAEAEETARLANLLGRSLYAAIALPLLGALTVAFSEGMGTARLLVWCAFVAAAAIAMLHAYFRTIDQPFERVALNYFAKDLSAILLFAGFAWGAGAFLALPAGTRHGRRRSVRCGAGHRDYRFVARARSRVSVSCACRDSCRFRERAAAVCRRRTLRGPVSYRLRRHRRRGGAVGSPKRRFRQASRCCRLRKY